MFCQYRSPMRVRFKSALSFVFSNASEESPILFSGERFFLPAVVRITAFCSHRKEVTKKGRPLVIGYSRPLLRFPSGLRNSLRSNSPRPLSSFSLASCGPINAGILASPCNWSLFVKRRCITARRASVAPLSFRARA